MFEVSKTVILARLHDMGIKEEFDFKKNLNPENYRCPVAPYGYQVQGGKLISNKKELQICRTVVTLIDRDGFTHSETARELERRGFKSRTGKSKWDSKTIFNIYKRWKGKI